MTINSPSPIPANIGALLVGMQLTDSALPTGAFSHSLGFESYMHTDHVTDEASFSQWLQMFVTTQLTFTDALAIKLAWEKESLDEVLHLDAILTAQALPKQIRHAGVTQAKRLLSIAQENYPIEEIVSYSEAVAASRASGHPALVWALIARNAGVAREEAIAQHMYATIISLTQNAVRAIPLGQSAGQRIIRRAQEWVGQALTTVEGLSEWDLGAISPGLEIAQMRHERQRARLFMS